MFYKIVFLLLLPLFVWSETEELTLPLRMLNRVDYALNYQHLSGDYGSIESGYITLTKQFSPLTKFLFNFTFITRREGTGSQTQLGAYHDFSEKFYTFSALTVGTKADFLPIVMVNQECFFKFGPCKQFVIPLAFSYAAYHNKQQSVTTGSGIIAYLGKWVLDYRLILVQNFPGHAIALSHTASVGYGGEGWQWIFLNAGYGRNSYFVVENGELSNNINQRVIYLNLNYRRWLGLNYGLLADARYTNIKNAYDVYSGTIGLFREF